jgi:hypothetical protein
MLLSFVVQICANFGAHAHFGAYLRDGAIPNKILLYKHWNYHPSPLRGLTPLRGLIFG